MPITRRIRESIFQLYMQLIDKSRGYLFFFVLMPSLAFGELVAFPPQPIDFGGGLNIGAQPSQIADNEAADMQNMINGNLGEASRRNGSRRWNTQAISTNPITSIHRVYVSSNNTSLKATIFTSGSNIYFSSFGVSITTLSFSTGIDSNQRWRWATMNNLAIGCPSSLQSDVVKFDLTRSSISNMFENFSTSASVRVRGKYPLATRDYFILGNTVLVSSPGALVNSTTYYNSRAYYSLVGQPSSFTATRLLDIRTDDGEEITGVDENNRMVHFFKETSIMELDFVFLNLTPLGGDQVLRQIVKGFGLFAPDTLANIGDGYIMGAKDGIRFWDGGRKTRLQIEQESRVLSDKIKPIIERLIRYGTYRSSVGKYYPKKQWYIFAYEDPLKQPRGRLNSVLVLDLKTFTWWPFVNWNPQCFATLDGIGDRGELVYGDNDGYIVMADDDLSKNDMRKELSINPMDATADWLRGQGDPTNFVEGTGAIKMVIPPDLKYSSITSMRLYDMSKWPDGSKISASDLLSFKIRFTSAASFQSIRVDLELDDDAGDEFNNIFTSVTINASALTAGNSNFNTVEIPISSFPILPEWIGLDTEEVPFADAQIYYGIRFLATTTAGGNGDIVTIDDIRVVQRQEQPLNAYYTTKLFNFGTSADKRFRKIILNKESPRDGVIFADAYNDFGQFVGRATMNGGFRKELYVAGFNGIEGISKLSSIDFSVLDSTLGVKEFAAFRSLTADKNFIYAGDVFNHRIFKIEVGSFTHFVSSVGSFGIGISSQFNNIFQIAIDEKNLYACDFGNHAVKVFTKDKLAFLHKFGELGRGTTNLHLPTGIAVDSARRWIADDGNRRILVLSSTFGFIQQERIPTGTFGNTRLQVDEKFLYVFYSVLSSTDQDFIDLTLEKRDKTDLRLISKMRVTPSTDTVSLSTSIVMGDMGQNDEFVFLSFTNDNNGNGSYFIQKVFKSDLSIAREYRSQNAQYGTASNGLAYLPKRSLSQEKLGFDGTHVQVKYAEGEPSLDNNFKLYSQQFLIMPMGIKEKD